MVGTTIYNQRTGEFVPHRGPIFAHIVLADEVNRAPAKVQAALLEAMQERQVTIGGETYPLPQPFLVLATQNPIEQVGTYPLPEAQVDRFMLKVRVGYPTRDEEKEILRRMSGGAEIPVSPVATPDEILQAREAIARAVPGRPHRRLHPRPGPRHARAQEVRRGRSWRRSSSTAPRRGPRWRWRRARGPTPTCAAAATWCPRT